MLNNFELIFRHQCLCKEHKYLYSRSKKRDKNASQGDPSRAVDECQNSRKQNQNQNQLQKKEEITRFLLDT